MLAKIEQVKAKYPGISVFTTGDYNFNKTHSAYQIMKSSGLGSAQEDATVSKTTSHGSYHSTVGSMPAANGLAIDHIFFSPETVTVLKHGIGYRAIDIQSSDHCPVYADIKFN
jgi:endonuclease/exonuclease/phosphatase family metal-dependent hydrolase